MSQNKPFEDWNEDMQYAYDSILFNHNPIEADKAFGEMLERVLTKLVQKTRQTSQEREREILQTICDMCDPNTPYHEDIWRVAYSRLQTLTNPNKD